MSTKTPLPTVNEKVTESVSINDFLGYLADCTLVYCLTVSNKLLLEERRCFAEIVTFL